MALTTPIARCFLHWKRYWSAIRGESQICRIRISYIASDASIHYTSQRMNTARLMRVSPLNVYPTKRVNKASAHLIIQLPAFTLGVLGIFIISMSLSACTGLPSLMLGGDSGTDAQHGPEVAALVAHLKCELSDAVNSNNKLPYYDDVPALTTTRQFLNPPDPRAFTLKNLFKEIEYVGEIAWTIDVTDTGALNPTASYSWFYSGQNNATLSVSGQLSEAAHRYLTFNTSVDFARLNATEAAPFEGITAPVPPLPPEKRPPCIDGRELTGELGLREDLAKGLIVNAMNDISAIKPLETASPGTIPGGITLGPIAVPSTYTFGQVSTQVDFTINEGVNGGPTWNLVRLKGPGGGSNGLLSFTRQVKDQIIATFVPVCIREKYWTNSTSAQYEYQPKLIEGTPPWANLLPPCAGVGYLQARLNAAAAAQSRNDLTLLQNALLHP